MIFIFINHVLSIDLLSIISIVNNGLGIILSLCIIYAR